MTYTRTHPREGRTARPNVMGGMYFRVVRPYGYGIGLHVDTN